MGAGAIGRHDVALAQLDELATRGYSFVRLDDLANQLAVYHRQDAARLSFLTGLHTCDLLVLDGGEIGRAQALQALAAGLAPPRPRYTHDDLVAALGEVMRERLGEEASAAIFTEAKSRLRADLERKAAE